MSIFMGSYIILQCILHLTTGIFIASFKWDICSSKNKNIERSFPKWTSPFIYVNWIRIIRMTGIRQWRPNPITGVCELRFNRFFFRIIIRHGILVQAEHWSGAEKQAGKPNPSNPLPFLRAKYFSYYRCLAWNRTTTQL